MLVADEFYDGEAQARTLNVNTRVLRPVEAVEEARETVFRNSNTIISYSHVDVLLVYWQVTACSPCLDGDESFFSGIVDGILNEVLEYT